MKQNIFRAQFVRTKKLNKPPQGGYKTARKMQSDGFSMLHDILWGIINAPTGSGKSLLMMMLAAYRLQADKKHTVIIAVPQTNIANGFIQEKFKLGHKKIHWFTNHILCGTNGTIDKFASLLTNTRDVGMEDRIIICTHQTLVLAYKKLAAKRKLKCLKNTSLFLDEAHHSCAEELINQVEQNGVGSVVRHYLKNKLNLLMITATFFRGDRMGLIPSKYRDLFTRYELPFDEYMQHTNIKNFSFDFYFFKTNYIEAFAEIYNPRKRTILYIPQTNTSCSIDSKNNRNGKYKEVNKILRSISDNGKYSRESDGSISLVSRGKKIRAIDLVQENRRDEHLSLIHENRKTGKIDLIVAMKTFQEGSDYPPLERVIVAGPRGSIGQIAQIAGRGFRDYGSKKKVEFVQLFPEIDREVRSSLNDYLNMIYCSMLMEEIISPTLKFNRNRKKGNRRNYLAEQFPDFDLRSKFVEDVMDQAIRETDLDFNGFVGLISKQEELCKCENKKEIAMQIWMMMVRRAVGQAKFSKLDFESIKHQDAMGFLTRYTSGVCGIDTLKDLRACLRKFLPRDEFIKQLRASGIKKYEREYLPRHKEYDGWPSSPINVYGMKWNSLIGERELRNGFLSLDEFIKQLRASGIKKYDGEYISEYKKHKGWPFKPAKEYGVKWNKLIGRDIMRLRSLPKDEFIKQLRASGIKTLDEYSSNYKKHKWWPGGPLRRYNMKWSELIGKNVKRMRTLPKDEFIKQLRASGIKSFRKYCEEYKKHKGWPGNPNKYKMKWNELVGRSPTLPKDEFIKQLRASGIKSFTYEYVPEYKKHEGWPRNPAKKYDMTWKQMVGRDLNAA